MALKISIGILAYNEEATIAETLQSLSQQTLLTSTDSNIQLELIIVPNGCTDKTATVARVSLEELLQPLTFSKIHYQICEIEQLGKSNAWNTYVHEFSATDADYLILMDADIQFINSQTLSLLVSTLEATPQAVVSVDAPIKDVALKSKKNLIEWLSVAVSKQSDMTQNWVPAICGQLYCGRASALRQIWMPIGLTVEDGFLRAMIATDGFTQSETPQHPVQRIVYARGASHIFEAYLKVSQLLKHERRQIVGNVVNAFLFGYLWANCGVTQQAGELIRRNNDRDPEWLKTMFQNTVAQQKGWMIPKAFVFRRFGLLQHRPLVKRILGWPIACIAFGVDLWVCWQANQVLKSGEAFGYWTERS